MGDEGGMFGRVPSVQTKVNEATETGQTLEKFLILIGVIFVGMWILYALINILFGLEDQYLIVNLALVGLCMFSAFKAERYSSRWLPDNLIEISNEGGVREFKVSRKFVFILVGIGLSYLASTKAAGFVVWMLYFKTEPIDDLVKKLFAYSVVALSVGFTVGVVPLFDRLFHEVKDRYHSPVEVARIKAQAEEERKKMALERKWALEDAEYEAPQLEAPKYSVSIKSGNTTQYQTLTKDEVEIIQFLEGIRDGKWTTSESTWTGQRLPTGVELSAVGGRIRDELLGGGWAEWRHPEEKRQGWILTDIPDEVIRGLVE